MKRRSFLKTLPVLAAAPLALSAIQARPKSHPRHLISLGTAASRMIEFHGKNLEFATFTLIDRESPPSSDVAAKFIQFTPPESIYQQIEHLRILKKEPLPILPLPQEIDVHLRPGRRIGLLRGVRKCHSNIAFPVYRTALSKPFSKVGMAGHDAICF
jgi:hypothetical protein